MQSDEYFRENTFEKLKQILINNIKISFKQSFWMMYPFKELVYILTVIRTDTQFKMH
jgi:hypothetical protein